MVVKSRDKQIRRANLRVYAALDETNLTLLEVAQHIGVRRETLSRKLQRFLSDTEQDVLIQQIRIAGSKTGSKTTGTTTGNTSGKRGRKRNVTST